MAKILSQTQNDYLTINTGQIDLFTTLELPLPRAERLPPNSLLPMIIRLKHFLLI